MKIMENVNQFLLLLVIAWLIFTIIYLMTNNSFHNKIKNVRYYGVYDENDNLLKVIYLYKRELTFSEIMKIKQDYKMFRQQTVFVREFDLVKNIREF